MPCDTMRYIRLTLRTINDEYILRKTLAALGWEMQENDDAILFRQNNLHRWWTFHKGGKSVTCDVETGQEDVEDETQEILNDEYSKQVILEKAKKACFKIHKVSEKQLALKRGDDTIKVSILPDQRVRIETDAISPAVHTSAERMIVEIEKALGGDVELIYKRKTNPPLTTERKQDEQR